jgi:hypothetical protein
MQEPGFWSPDFLLAAEVFGDVLRRNRCGAHAEGSLPTAGIHREEDDGRIVLRSERPHVLPRYRLCPIDPRRRPGP